MTRSSPIPGVSVPSKGVARREFTQCSGGLTRKERLKILKRESAIEAGRKKNADRAMANGTYQERKTKQEPLKETTRPRRAKAKRSSAPRESEIPPEELLPFAPVAKFLDKILLPHDLSKAEASAVEMLQDELCKGIKPNQTELKVMELVETLPLYNFLKESVLEKMVLQPSAPTAESKAAYASSSRALGARPAPGRC